MGTWKYEIYFSDKHGKNNIFKKKVHIYFTNVAPLPPKQC